MTFSDRGGELPRHKPWATPPDREPGLIKAGTTWQVTEAHAEHVQPYLDSLAYRIDSDERSVVLTGDTRPCESVTNLARGADVRMMMCWESHERMDGNEYADASCSIRRAAETAPKLESNNS